MMGEKQRLKPDQYMMRFPVGMRDQLKAIADKNGRSLCDEILHLIDKGLEANQQAELPALRDQFAMAALSATLLSEYEDLCLGKGSLKFYSEHMYEIADMMLEARNEEGK